MNNKEERMQTWLLMRTLTWLVSVVIQTTSGRILTGLAVDRNDVAITLADSKGEKQVVAISEIEDLLDSNISLMPDNLYLQLRPQELRDLFAYLQSKK